MPKRVDVGMSNRATLVLKGELKEYCFNIARQHDFSPAMALQMLAMEGMRIKKSQEQLVKAIEMVNKIADVDERMSGGAGVTADEKVDVLADLVAFLNGVRESGVLSDDGVDMEKLRQIIT